jgi:hypothetical protein
VDAIAEILHRVMSMPQHNRFTTNSWSMVWEFRSNQVGASSIGNTGNNHNANWYNLLIVW